MSNRGGMSVSNQYDVQFEFTSKVSGAIAQYISNVGVVGTNASDDYILKYFCDEAQLPNVGTMTGQLTGRYTGMGTVAYAHTPVYTEFQLGWMCDANMTPLKFLTAWHNVVIGQGKGANGARGENLEEMRSKTSLSQLYSVPNRPITISYPDDYCCKLRVTKVEQGQTEETRRPSITYVMERAFPMSIDAVPLSYGNSQLTRVTATFQYSRHFTYTNDITGDTNYLESNVRKPDPDGVTIPTEEARSELYIRTNNGVGAGTLSGTTLGQSSTIA
jgi:hypothetical protein